MLKLHIQAKAKNDLKEIWHYSYASFGERKADEYFNVMETRLKALKENPELGSRCDYIRAGYRKFHIQKHIVFYKIMPSKIQIIRILHQKVDFKQHF